MTTPEPPEPPRWDAPPAPPAWDRPQDGASGWGPPPEAPVGYGGPGGHGAGPQQTDVKAVVALALALGSFFVLPLLPALGALWLASRSSRDIAASGGRLTGSGLLTATRVLAWINIALCVAGVVLVVLGLLFFTSVGFS